MPRDIGGTKRGRNEPCWCGSGLKYKNCHLDRAEQPRLRGFEAVQILDEAYSHESCSCPPAWTAQCSGQIVKAHSISKNAGLSAIAESGHVYEPKPDFSKMIHKNDFDGKFVGVNRASTFTGFCGNHDQSIFRPPDTQEFDGSLQLTFLAAYRTMCRDRFAKIGQINTFHGARSTDKGRSSVDQLSIQSMLSAQIASANLALKEINEIKKRFDEALVASDLSGFSYKNYLYDARTDILASGCFNPSHGVNGRRLQDLSDLSKTSEHVIFSILPSGDHFWASFLWLPESQVATNFVKGVDERNALAGTMFGIALTYMENCFLRPSAITSMRTEDQQTIERLAFTGVVSDDYKHLPQDFLSLESLYPQTVQRIAASF